MEIPLIQHCGVVDHDDSGMKMFLIISTDVSSKELKEFIVNNCLVLKYGA